jgi:uncharacterized protein
MSERLWFIQQWLLAHVTKSWVPKRNVAASYALGQGVAVDGARARKWYRRAAKAGDESALYDLGLMCLAGEGGPVDADLGLSLIRQAAELGDGMAQLVLMDLYGQGLHGIAVDREQEERWRDTAQKNGMKV